MIYNPLDKFYKSITGAVRVGEKVKFRVKGCFDSVLFVVRKDWTDDYVSFPMLKEGEYFYIDYTFTDSGLFWYKFEIDSGEFIGLNDQYVGKISSTPTEFQLTVYDADYHTPDWLKGGLIYQIFPDRYNCSGERKESFEGKIIHADKSDTPIFLPDEKGVVQNNDFFGGDLKGITLKLDYLSSLGVTAIYLNPIFKAYSNHRYDTGDYMQIDELLGSKNDFIELIEKAKLFGIRIILDGVFNHTGDDSLYFNRYGNYDGDGAYQSEASPYYNWFKFIKYPDLYESWWGIKTLPATDKQNEEFLQFITGENGVLDYWTKLGIGGWRLDVVDELPAHFVEKIRSAVKNVNSDAVVIGEVWEDASNKIAYSVRRRYFQGKELDSVMNYPLKDAILNFVKTGNCNQLCYVIKEQLDHYPKIVLDTLMNILSTHDTFRLISALGDVNVDGMSKSQMADISLNKEEYTKALARVKLASLLSYTLCGVPCVYYGDEVGMQGYKDPLNRKFFEWDKVGCELNKWYKKLGKIRQSYSAFATGDFAEVYAKDGLYVFKRSAFDNELLIAVNADNEKEHMLKFGCKLTDLLTENEYDSKFNLPPVSCAVLVNKSL